MRLTIRSLQTLYTVCLVYTAAMILYFLVGIPFHIHHRILGIFVALTWCLGVAAYIAQALLLAYCL